MPALPGPRPSQHRLRRPLATVATGTLAVVLALVLLGSSTGGSPRDRRVEPVDLAASSTNKPTPGNFTGYGFDQCVAPTQAKMDAWLESSPFMAVGIYISGNSRACRDQPNLNATWVKNQIAKGWKLLPITLGPQASCSGRYPRYGAKIDPKITASSAQGYAAAVAEGRLEANRAVKAAEKLGIVPGSTLFYDLEAFDTANSACKHSAIRFIHAWSERLHAWGYKSGFYSSAGSGIAMLDWLRKNNSAGFVLPDILWVARWDGKPGTAVSSQYLDPNAWMPGRRVKQYQGGHNETWGGVTINIDRNYLDIGPGLVAQPETRCRGFKVDLPRYGALRPVTSTVTPSVAQTRALQCLLAERNFYRGSITGTYDSATRAAAMRWQGVRGYPTSTTWSVRDWMILLSIGSRPVLKVGSKGVYVVRVQRAIQAALPSRKIAINGVYDDAMAANVKAYQKAVGAGSSGVVNTATWTRLQAGKY